MDDNFINDRETLAQFVDALLQQSPRKLLTPSEQIAHRQQLMHQLDEHLVQSLFARLPDAELAEAERLVADPSTPPSAYDALFQRAGIDLEKTYSAAAKKFAADYLASQKGGANA